MAVYFRIMRFSQGRAKFRSITIPVNPSEITFNIAGRNQSSEIVGLGDIIRLRKPSLISFSINSFLPAYKGYNYVQDPSTWHHPKEIIDFINQLQEDRTSFLFTIYEDMDWTWFSSENSVAGLYGSMTGGITSAANFVGDMVRNEQRQPISFSRRVSISDFSWGYKAADEDIHFSIDCKEYREFGAKKVVKKTSSEEETIVKTEEKTRVSSDLYESALVVLNGPVYQSSFGGKPGKAYSGYEGYIVRIIPDKTRKFGILVSDSKAENNLGWVSADQLVVKEFA